MRDKIFSRLSLPRVSTMLQSSGASGLSKTTNANPLEFKWIAVTNVYRLGHVIPEYRAHGDVLGRAPLQENRAWRASLSKDSPAAYRTALRPAFAQIHRRCCVAPERAPKE